MCKAGTPTATTIAAMRPLPAVNSCQEVLGIFRAARWSSFGRDARRPPVSSGGMRLSRPRLKGEKDPCCSERRRRRGGQPHARRVQPDGKGDWSNAPVLIRSHHLSVHRRAGRLKQGLSEGPKLAIQSCGAELCLTSSSSPVAARGFASFSRAARQTTPQYPANGTGGFPSAGVP